MNAFKHNGSTESAVLWIFKSGFDLFKVEEGDATARDVLSQKGIKRIFQERYNTGLFLTYFLLKLFFCCYFKS